MQSETWNNFSKTSRRMFFFILIGIVAGLGAVAFHFLCEVGFSFFMDFLAGFHPPAPSGEKHLFSSSGNSFNRYILLFLPALGGLISGVLVYTFCPEAEGHGTDAAINAYHNKKGQIRKRVPFIKTLASTVTLTSGGSGGREGPIAQIGAGFGSFLATKLGLSERERRIMLAAGMGAGIGSIFKAPLAGALFAAEVLYRDPEIESEVIIPAGLSSVVAYCIFCSIFGWHDLFSPPELTFSNPLELFPYTVLAVTVTLFGWLYVTTFYTITDFFKKMKIKPHFRPAIGGLLTGLIGFFWPHTLSFGYGYIQLALNSEATIWLLLTLAIGKILTTSFSIGSGGSGGVFGPSVVIGGALGGVIGIIFHQLMPNVVTQPAAFVIVGMAGFFAGVSNTPISTVIFISEMTSSYYLLLPSMLVCSLSYIASQRWTIFKNQPQNKMSSPAHSGEFFVELLENIQIKNLQNEIKMPILIPKNMRLGEFKKILSQSRQHYFPVVDIKGKLSGIVSSTDLREFLFDDSLNNLLIVDDIAQKNIRSVTLDEDIGSVMRKFTQQNVDTLPVVNANEPTTLIGMINQKAVINSFNRQLELQKTKQKIKNEIL